VVKKDKATSTSKADSAASKHKAHDFVDRKLSKDQTVFSIVETTVGSQNLLGKFRIY